MKPKKRTNKISLLQLLAPFLVDRWHNHPDGFTFAKLWLLWDALDREEARRDGRDDTCI